MAPHQLNSRLRIVLIIVSVLLFGTVAFFVVMHDLELQSFPDGKGSMPVSSTAISPISTRSPSSTVTSAESGLPRGIVHVNGVDIPVEFALDETSQEKGLSDRMGLPEHDGMLFVMGKAQNQMYWMGGMRFPLDMVFINGTIVVRVAANVPPPKFGEFPAIRSSDGKADKVLEINAGKAAEWGITEGTEIAIDE